MTEQLVIIIVMSFLMVALTHEGGHYFTALIQGLKPSLSIKKTYYVIGGVKIPIITLVTDWSDGSGWRGRLTATMGFGTSMIFSQILPHLVTHFPALFDPACVDWFNWILILHFLTYPFRMTDSIANDFNHMDADNNPRN